MAAGPRATPAWWPSLIPVAGCAVLGLSTLSVYVSDLATQSWCSGTIVCRGFQADPRALAAGIGFLIVALALLTGSLVAAARGPGAGRAWLAPLLCLGVASSFAVAVVLLTVAGTSALSSDAIPVILWAFLGVGYVILWTVTAFPSAIAGRWRFPARYMAILHGAVCFIATGFTLKNALLPGHFFL